MTAGHCCGQTNVNIVVGEHDASDYLYIYGDDVEHLVELTSSDWTIHPKYDEATIDYDVCIIKSQSGGFLKNGKTACLPEKGIKVTS